jgi:hypothetical protein
MTPQDQQAALARVRGDTNLSINERRRIAALMLERRNVPASIPEGGNS